MINANEPIAKYYDIIYSDLKGYAINQEEIALMSFLIPKGSSVLDVGGGTGRHAIELSKMGFKVTVVDSSAGMLNSLNAKLVKEHKVNFENIKIINDDIYSFKSKLSFDLIILMWNTFNEIALTKVNATRLLKKLKSKLNFGGSIIINIDDASIIKPADFNFSISKSFNNEDYVLNWKTIKYFKKTNTSISKETLNIFKDSILLETLEDNIKQRYWYANDIKRISSKIGLNFILKKVDSSSEQYIQLITNK